MTAADIEANKEKQFEEIKIKDDCVIGDVGSIGSSFIKPILWHKSESVAVLTSRRTGGGAGARCAKH